MKKKRRRGNGEGTIFEDKKNKRWIGQYISGIAEDGKAIRKSVYGKTQKEVVNKLNEVKYQMNNDIYVEKMEDRLADILRMIEGAGRVEVMITLASSSEAVVNKDQSLENDSEKETGQNGNEKTNVAAQENGCGIYNIHNGIKPSVL